MDEQINEFEINTREIYYQLREQYNNYSVELLIEFRDRLEDILIKYEKISLEFHPSSWRYFRKKYLQSSNEKWRRTEERNKFQVFNLTYFMHDNVRKKRISIHSLTDDEKIQIVAPLREETSVEEQRPSIRISKAKSGDIIENLSPVQNPLLIKIKRENAFELLKTLKSHKTLIFEDLSQEERQEILSKLCPLSVPISPDDFNGLAGMLVGNRRLINCYNENDSYDWWRWEYDIYTLDMSCKLQIETDHDDFEYFFAWQLALTDLHKIKKFLQLHLKNTFRNNLIDFKDFIEISYLKYERILFGENNKKVVFKHLDRIEVKVEEIINIEKLGNDTETTTINFPRTNNPTTQTISKSKNVINNSTIIVGGDFHLGDKTNQ
jgi:hypothetical protein